MSVEKSMLAGFPAKVFIIGAQKAGTTQLAAMLDQHPDVCLSFPKEPDFYSRHYPNGHAWFKQRFENPEKVLIDASTSYTSRPLPETFETDALSDDDPYCGVPQRIFSEVPDAKFIYIMRDPVQRAYSAYWHQVRAGLETQSLEQAISENSYYKRVSMYSEQLKPYLDVFKKEQFLLLKFEDLIKTPEDTIAKTLGFLELSPLQSLDTGGHKNQSFQYTGVLGSVNRALSGVGGMNKVLKKVRKFVPQSAIDSLKGHVAKPVPKITPEQVAWMDQFFDDEIDKAFQLFED